jgi:hypothetical protein
MTWVLFIANNPAVPFQELLTTPEALDRMGLFFATLPL